MDKNLENYFSSLKQEQPPVLNTAMIERTITERNEKRTIRLVFSIALLLILVTIMVLLLFPTPFTKIIMNFGFVLVILPLGLSLIVLLSIYTTMKGSFK